MSDAEFERKVQHIEKLYGMKLSDSAKRTMRSMMENPYDFNHLPMTQSVPVAPGAFQLLKAYGLLDPYAPVNCRCTLVPLKPPEPTAEELIDYAACLSQERTIEKYGAGTEGRAKLLTELNKKPPAWKLRAMMEGWDIKRIVEELY